MLLPYKREYFPANFLVRELRGKACVFRNVYYCLLKYFLKKKLVAELSVSVYLIEENGFPGITYI